jgi:arginyl-tRNA synthetase
MATEASFDNLAKQFKHLPLVDKMPNCYPDINPVDIYRAHITSIMHDITGVDKSIIYPALQWTATVDKGDLMLAIPALRVKGKPDDLGKQWLDKVLYSCNGVCWRIATADPPPSGPKPLSSKSP